MPKITILGIGSADTIQYYNASFFLEDNEKTGMLVDTGGGNGILSQLHKANIPLEKIDRVFLTHHHMDHSLGVLWILRFLGSKINKDPSLSLTIYCTSRTKQIIESLFVLLKKKVTDLIGSRIILHGLKDGEKISFEFGTMTCFNISSQKDSQFGFRYDFNNGKSLVMLGDESYRDHLKQYCANATVLIHDAYCLEEHLDRFHPEGMSHSTVKEAAENAQLLGAKKLILLHSEEKATLGKRKELYSHEGGQYFSGDIIAPDDLDVLEI